MKEISFGRVLLRLFQTARRFNLEVQPQLVLLQKTLLNIEGLGRELDPDLDLWVTAKPYLESWMGDQVGWGALMKGLAIEGPRWSSLLPQLPRLLHQALQSGSGASTEMRVRELEAQLRRLEYRERLMSLVVGAILIMSGLWWWGLT